MPKSDASFSTDGYAPVADRIRLFYQRFPGGRIATELVSRADGEITFKAMVFREEAAPYPAATGWASEREGDGDVNTVACLENAETSAVGRALANLGFTASRLRPSREEMEKADRARRRSAGAGAGVAPASFGPVRQELADAALDLLDLLGAAERRGFPVRRAGLVRDRIAGAPGPSAARLHRLERRLRGWLRRRGG